MGAFEATTHWSRLLDEVATGEEVVITKRGVPVARVVRATAEEPTMTPFTPKYWAAIDRRAAAMDARGAAITLDTIRTFIDARLLRAAGNARVEVL